MVKTSRIFIDSSIQGVLDSLMSATYFNASLLKLLRLLVTGGATIHLEKSLAEGAGLRGGYSTEELEQSKNRIRVEEIVLRESRWARYAENGARQTCQPCLTRPEALTFTTVSFGYCCSCYTKQDVSI